MPDTIPLLDYVESRFAALQRAVDKAEEATEKRFQSVNEMRAMVTDAASKFMPRLEYDSSHAALVDKVESLQKMMWVGTGVMLAIQFLIGILLVFWRKT